MARIRARAADEPDHAERIDLVHRAADERRMMLRARSTSAEDLRLSCNVKKTPTKTKMGRPRKWPKDAKQTAFKMDKESWEGLQWLAERYDVCPSEAARLGIRMLVAVEQERVMRGLAPLDTPALKEPLAKVRPVTKAYEFLFGKEQVAGCENVEGNKL